jgi:hypothetical protein
MDYVVTFDWNGAECTNNATGETATCPVKKIQRSVANPEAFGTIVFDDIPADGYSTVKQPMGWSDTSNEAKCGSSSLYKHGDIRTPYFYDDTGEVRPFVTYYAIWECEYTVTLLSGTGRNVVFNDPSNTNSGYKLGNTVNDDVEINVVTTSNSYNFALPLTTPTATNGYFAGWKCTRNCVGTDSSAPLHGVGDTIHFAQGESKRTFAAQWNPITYSYKLVYNLGDGGQGNFPDINETVGTTSYTFNISHTEPTKSGYKFLGWSTTSGSSTVSYGGSTNKYSWAVENTTPLTTVTKNLYAVWELDVPAVSLYQVTATFSGDVDTFLKASNGVMISLTSAQIWQMDLCEGRRVCYLGNPYIDANNNGWMASGDGGRDGSASTETKTFPAYSDVDYVYYAHRYEGYATSVNLTIYKDGSVLPGYNKINVPICHSGREDSVIFRINNGVLTMPDSSELGTCLSDSPLP